MATFGAAENSGERFSDYRRSIRTFCFSIRIDTFSIWLDLLSHFATLNLSTHSLCGITVEQAGSKSIHAMVKESKKDTSHLFSSFSRKTSKDFTLYLLLVSRSASLFAGGWFFTYCTNSSSTQTSHCTFCTISTPQISYHLPNLSLDNLIYSLLLRPFKVVRQSVNKVVHLPENCANWHHHFLSVWKTGAGG